MSTGAVLKDGERLGVVGGGNMVKALVLPLIDRGLIDASKVSVSARTAATLEPWKQRGCLTTTDNAEVTATSDIVIWGVKPQMFRTAVPAGWNVSKQGCSKLSSLHVSVMAGITAADIRQQLMTNIKSPGEYSLRLLRTMPSIGSKVNCGCVAYALDGPTVERDKEFAEIFFGATGICFEVVESQLNAYAAVFGSGIGFMFPILEGMADGGVKMGIPRAVAYRLAAQTMKGAGELLLQEGKHPGALKDEVCSPGGSTIAGIAAMEQGGVRSAMISAIEATTKRNAELGQLK